MKRCVLFAVSLLACIALADIDTTALPPIPIHSFRPPFSTGLSSLPFSLSLASPCTLTPAHCYLPTGRAGIRWWNYGGDVMVYQDFLRLTPDAKSKNGFIWNKNVCAPPPNNHTKKERLTTHPKKNTHWNCTAAAVDQGLGGAGVDAD